MESGTGGAGGGSDLPVPSVRGEALRKKPERKLDLKLGYYFFGLEVGRHHDFCLGPFPIFVPDIPCERIEF